MAKVDMSYIPRTEAALSISADIYVVVPVSTTQMGVKLQIPLTAAIGTINKFTRGNDQVRNKRYTLGKHAFEPLDILSGQISSNIVIDKVVLYKHKYMIPGLAQLEQLGLSQTDTTNLSLEVNGEAQGLFNIVSGNTLYQQKPVHIQVINYDYSTTTDNLAVTSIQYYWNCWFTSNPITYNVQDPDDIIIIQTCELTVGRIETYEPNITRATSALISSILPSGVTL